MNLFRNFSKVRPFLKLFLVVVFVSNCEKENFNSESTEQVSELSTGRTVEYISESKGPKLFLVEKINDSIIAK